MTTADDAPPSRLAEKPTWLISETSRHAHRLLAEAGSRGYDYRLLAALQEFGLASQAGPPHRDGPQRCRGGAERPHRPRTG
jgi:hypothetical protein